MKYACELLILRSTSRLKLSRGDASKSFQQRVGDAVRMPVSKASRNAAKPHEEVADADEFHTTPP